MAASTADAPQYDPDWLDRDRYPFDSHFLDLDPGRLHYVDEGEGRPIVMLHGNPTWSFLYRHLIAGLSADYRCIAPDYLGFGLSDKPRGWSYRPADHARVVGAFVETLGLDDVTLVVHDWGGPIGCSYAIERPETVRSLVVANTFLWPLDDWRIRAFSAVVGGRIGRLLIRRYNLFADHVMRSAVVDESAFTPAVRRHYTAPLATPDDRTPSWVFPRELRGSRDFLSDLWDRRDRIADTPALLAWGTRDAVLGPMVERWASFLSDARTVAFEDAGHYVQEDAGSDLVPPVREFLEER